MDKAYWEQEHGINEHGNVWLRFCVSLGGQELSGCLAIDKSLALELAKDIIRARPDVDWAAVLREIEAERK